MKTKYAKFIVIMTISFLFCLAAPAQTINEKCMIRGWIQDKNRRKDIYIYNGPGQISPFKPYDIIGGLDSSIEDGEQKPVEIIGFKLHPRAGSWIQIRKANDFDGKLLFEGDGWIHSERVTAQVRSLDEKAVALYSLPKASGQKVGKIPDKTLLTIIGFDCFGLKVSYKGKSGWLSAANICGDPVKPCQP